MEEDGEGLGCGNAAYRWLKAMDESEVLLADEDVQWRHSAKAEFDDDCSLYVWRQEVNENISTFPIILL